PQHSNPQHSNPQHSNPQHNNPHERRPYQSDLQPQHQAAPAPAPPPLHRDHPGDSRSERSGNPATASKPEEKASEPAITRDPAPRRSR
ncbi:MAG: hypothetical protein M3Z36_11110, partial [Acidobacteriota bacterium]|nr:hypothetical protein [Acidobacteriota bacterium]